MRTLSDGTIEYYGETLSKRLIINEKTIAWMKGKVVDGNYNEMLYSYNSNGASIWLDDIIYTNNPYLGVYGNATVHFQYTNEPNICDSYLNGVRLRSSRLISGIIVSYQGSQVRKYSFIYDKTGLYSRLTCIQLFDADNNLMASTRIVWDSLAGQTVTTEASFTTGRTRSIMIGRISKDDLRPSIVSLYEINPPLTMKKWDKQPDGSYHATNIDLGIYAGLYWNNMMLYDFDGDGVDEIIHRNTFGSSAYTMLKIGNPIIQTSLTDYNDTDGKIFMGDFDGDGKNEAVYLYEHQYLNGYELNGCSNYSLQHLTDRYSDGHVGDFDGDGKADLMLLDTTNTSIYSYNANTGLWYKKETSGFPNTWQYVTVCDFNADGLSDILFLPNNESQWKVAMRKGPYSWTLTTIPELDGSHVSYNVPTHVPIVCDLNGDGRSDILQIGDSHTIKYIITRGTLDGEYLYYDPVSITADAPSSYTHYTLGDLDGNGTPEIIFYKADGATNDGCAIVNFIQHNHSNRCVTEFVDSIGGLTKIEYATLQQMPERYDGDRANVSRTPMVKNLIRPDGIGGDDTTCFLYGNMRIDSSNNIILGFEHFAKRHNETTTEYLYSPISFEELDNNRITALLPSNVHIYTSIDYPYSNPRHNPDNSILWHGNSDVLVSSEEYVQQYMARSTQSKIMQILPYPASSIYVDYLKNKKNITVLSLHSDNWLPLNKTSVTVDNVGELNIKSYENEITQYINTTLTNGATIPQVVQKTEQRNIGSSNQRFITQTLNTYTNGRLTQQVVKQSNGYSDTISHFYNNGGALIRSTTHPVGAMPRTTQYQYDASYRVITRITDPAGQYESYTYDPKTLNKLSHTDINGLRTTYQYDFWGRITAETNPNGITKRTMYGPVNVNLPNVTSLKLTIIPGHPQIYTYYDILGREVFTYSHLSGYNEKEYDHWGRLVRQTILPYKLATTPDNNKQWKTFTYDSLGRLSRELSFYEDNRYSYAPLPYSNPDNSLYYECVTNKRGASKTTYYDAAGRILRVVDNSGETVYAYGSCSYEPTNDYVEQITISAANNQTIIKTDIRNRRLSILDPDAGESKSLYNPWGELVMQINGKNDTTHFVYDILGRMTSKTYSNGSQSDTYTFIYNLSHSDVEKGQGKVGVILHDGIVHQTYTYDSLGRLDESTRHVDNRQFTNAYTYDSLGRISSRMYPSGFAIRYVYNNYGELEYIKDAASGFEIYHIDKRNNYRQPLRAWYGNNTGVQYGYNSYGMPTFIQYGYRVVTISPNAHDEGEKPNFVIPGDGETEPITWPDPYSVGNHYSVLHYTYNDTGYITRRHDAKTNQFEEYRYDTLGRLSHYTVNGTHQYEFSYNSAGNMIHNSRLSSSNYEYSHPQPHAVSGVEIYDSLLLSGHCSVTYNQHNRPSSIYDNGHVIRFEYDINDKRHKSVFSYNGNDILTVYKIGRDYEYELTPSTSRHLEYIYADGRPVAIHVSDENTLEDTIYYVQTDLLGSWERITDESRAIVQASHFDPWGNRMLTSAWDIDDTSSSYRFRRGFTGHEHYDRFRIINMGARLYDPIVARFFSPDPYIQNPFSSAGFDRYSYCGNNPIMYSDPEGEFFGSLLIASLIAGAINLGIHIHEGDVKNVWDGITHFGIGALSVVASELFWAGIGTIGRTVTQIANVVASIGRTVDVITTTFSFIQNPSNASKVFFGLFYFDSKYPHAITQALTRFTTERLQTWVGYNYSHSRNALGDVERVDYYGGATFLTNDRTNKRQGITWGNYINIDLNASIGMDFKKYVLSDQMFMHEYGHSIDSQTWGFLYLLAIGIPSGLSELIDHDHHGTFYTEELANFWGVTYFNNIEWNTEDNQLPPWFNYKRH